MNKNFMIGAILLPMVILTNGFSLESIIMKPQTYGYFALTEREIYTYYLKSNNSREIFDVCYGSNIKYCFYITERIDYIESTIDNIGMNHLIILNNNPFNITLNFSVTSHEGKHVVHTFDSQILPNVDYNSIEHSTGNIVVSIICTFLFFKLCNFLVRSLFV